MSPFTLAMDKCSVWCNRNWAHGMDKSLHLHKTLRCNYPPMPNFNGEKLWHGWVITTLISMWLWLHIHALYSKADSANFRLKKAIDSITYKSILRLSYDCGTSLCIEYTITCAKCKHLVLYNRAFTCGRFPRKQHRRNGWYLTQAYMLFMADKNMGVWYHYTTLAIK